MGRFTRWASVAAAALALASCSSSSDNGSGAPGGTAGPCDPLDSITSAVKIQASDIIGAGRDTDGTSYVLLSNLQVFVSSVETLIEQPEHGAGSTTVGGAQTWVSSYVDAQGVTVTVEVQSDAAGQRMGVVKGPISAKTYDVGSMGDVLEPIDAAVAAAMPAKVTQTFHVELVGVEPDGVTNVVVTAPDYLGPSTDDGFTGFRVFIGPVNALAEQAGPITAGRASYTQLGFTIDGAPAELIYGTGNGAEGVDELTIGSDTVLLTDAASLAVPSGAMFVCR